MALIANDILEDCSYVLYEPIVATTLGTVVAPGSVTVTPPSMVGIYNGALLLVDKGAAGEEVVTASGCTPTTFNATFANAHLAAAAVNAATFSKGETTADPLFTQAEMLGYLADAQNKFLVQTECIYDTESVAYSANDGEIYANPASSINIVRIAIAGKTLKSSSQHDLNLHNPAWQAEGAGVPELWYEDRVGTNHFGLAPAPALSGVADTWFAKGGSQVLALNATFLLPDPLTHFLKYGVLARCYSKDGEQRDPQRAEYCDKRFDFGVMLTHKFMEGVQAMLRGFEPRKNVYKPLVVTK